MSDKVLKAPQPTQKRVADMAGPDFYPTPPWATYALVQNEPFTGDIWECACGDGAMSEVLRAGGYKVTSTDLYNRGYGEIGVDFTISNRKSANVVTNPPYNLAEQFVSRGLLASQNKLALLLRLAFLEGGRRQKSIFNQTPPARVWVFSERITFYPKDAQRRGSGTTAYAWFVWDKHHAGGTELRWLPIGYKSRFA